jgi:hypothetical protein
MPCPTWLAGIIHEDSSKEVQTGVDMRSPSEALLAKIRLHTRTGRPIYHEDFITDLESRLGCRVHALANGRPRKWTSRIVSM